MPLFSGYSRLMEIELRTQCHVCSDFRRTGKEPVWIKGSLPEFEMWNKYQRPHFWILSVMGEECKTNRQSWTWTLLSIGCWKEHVHGGRQVMEEDRPGGNTSPSISCGTWAMDPPEAPFPSYTISLITPVIVEQLGSGLMTTSSSSHRSPPSK